MKYALLCLVLLIQSLLLFRDIPSLSYSFIGDEYQFFSFAEKITTGRWFGNPFSQKGVYQYHPVADSIVQASVMKLFGADIYGWKITNILVLSVSTVLLFLIAEALWHRARISLLSAVFFGFSHYLFAFAHIGYNNLHALVPSLAAYYLYIRGLSGQKRRYIFLSGAAAGLCLYTFYTARIVGALLVLSALWHRKRIWYFMGGLAVTVLPFIFVNSSAVISQNAAQMSLQSLPQFAANYIRFISGLFTTGSIPVHHFVVGPLISPFLTVSFLGFFMYFRQQKKSVRPALFILILWFLLISIISVGTFYDNTIPTTRLHLLVPPIALLGAYAVVELISSVRLLSVMTVMYVVFELTLFYAVTPTKQDLSKGALIMTFAASRPSDTICLGPHQFGDVSFVIDMYHVPNIVNAATVRNQSHTCSVFIPFTHSDDTDFFVRVAPRLLDYRRLNVYSNRYKPDNSLVYYE